ncbi:hypothetical protein BJX96DRAFT_171108 [Aspergillus floccosus]
MGLQLVEKSLPSGRKDEEKKEEKRRIYWYLVQTDLMFRLLYDKPPCIEEPVLGVRPPSVIRPAKMPQLSACETILQVIWTRAVVIGVEYFDSINTDGSVRSEGDNNTIDSCCAQIENLLADWDLLNVVKSMASDDLMTWFYAESVIALYSIIVFMRRKASMAMNKAHPQAVQASRIIISTIIEFSNPTISFSGAHRVFKLLFISFYPFCAFFTLYQKIITAPSLEECENDILSLEAVVREMTRLTSIRSDFVPITNVMNALNRVSRAIHRAHQNNSESALPLTIEPPAPLNPSTNVNLPSEQGLQTFNNFSASAIQQETTDNHKSVFGLPFEMGSDVAFQSVGSSTTAATATPAVLRSDALEGLNEPVDFVRAIEEELVWRNWHDSWWGNGLGDMPTLGGHDMPGAS